MQTQQPYLVKNIDLDNILYSDIRKAGSKKYIQISYNDSKKGEQRFIYQSPEFYNVYDIKLVEGGSYYELEIPLYGEQKRKINEFIKFIANIDQKNIEYGKDNIGIMFEIEKGIKPRYKSTIRLSKETDYYNKNGVIKIKIHPDTFIIENGKRIPPTNLKKGNTIRFIFENLALWIQQDGFGMFIKPILIEQIKKKVIEAYSFAEDSDDDDDEEEYSNYGDTEIEPSNMFVPYNYEKITEEHKQTEEHNSLEEDVNNNNENVIISNELENKEQDDSVLYAEDDNKSDELQTKQSNLTDVKLEEDSVLIETVEEEPINEETKMENNNVSNMTNVFITETEDSIHTEHSNQISNMEPLTIDIGSDDDDEIEDLKF
jgi:hypothetical protein